METFWKIVGVLASIAAFCALTYGMYWVFKSFSYWLFYEDMVQESIKQMVKPEFLR